MLKADPAVAAYSKRVKLGAMFSNFTENSSIRLNGVDAAAEDAAVPALRQRISEGNKTGPPGRTWQGAGAGAAGQRHESQTR
jgi:putative ABC transport system permease protein